MCVLLTAAACFDPEPPAAETGVVGDDTSGESEGGTGCVVGSLDCPCDGANACEEPLACVDSVCVDTTDPSSSDDTETSSDSSDSSGSSSTGLDVDPSDGDDPWSAWSHHRELTISPQSDLVEHQVRVDLPLTASVGPDGADIRVVDADGNVLPLWVEGPDGDHSRIWIKVADLVDGVDVAYTIYYGNPDATSVSDPHAVFELFDDFESLDDTRWAFQPGWSLGADGATTTSGYAGSMWITDAPAVVEAVVRWSAEDGGIEPSTGVALLGSFGGYGVTGMPLSYTAVSTHTPLDPATPGAPVHMTITRRPDAFEVAIDETPVAVQLAGPIDGPYQVGIGRLTGLDEAYDTMEIDRIFVRRYAPSPGVVLGPEQ
jgi:hypothetical protein